MGLQDLERPEIRVLKGEEAKKALVEYIGELEASKPEELTGEQTKIMIKLAKGLVSAIECETTIPASNKRLQLIPKFKSTVGGFLSQIFQDNATPILTQSPEPKTKPYCPSPNQRII